MLFRSTSGTGPPGPVQQHAQACCAPPTSPDALGASGFRPPGRNPGTKRSQPHRHRNHHPAARLRVLRRVGPMPCAKAGVQWSEGSTRALRARVSRRGRRRSQGAMTDTSWFEPSPHQQAKRPQAHRQSSTHSGPPTSHGASRPRAAARLGVLRTSDLA